MSNIAELNDLLWKHNCVESIHLDSEEGLGQYNLVMTLAESQDPGAHNVSVVFMNVGDLKISEFGGGLTQFMDLRVSRVEGGLDRIRYELIDDENEKIAFNFYTFELLQGVPPS